MHEHGCTRAILRTLHCSVCTEVALWRQHVDTYAHSCLPGTAHVFGTADCILSISR